MFELPILEEIESVTAGGWLFSRHDRVEEEVVEVANLTCISNASISTKLHRVKNLRTFINMHM